VRIDGHGAVKNAVADRWGSSGQKEFGYIPCGCEVHAERRFGNLVVPSRVTVGWWFGTPRYAPFFKAETTISRLRAGIRAGRAQRGFAKLIDP
jgi:hypothetical protein